MVSPKVFSSLVLIFIWVYFQFSPLPHPNSLNIILTISRAIPPSLDFEELISALLLFFLPPPNPLHLSFTTAASIFKVVKVKCSAFLLPVNSVFVVSSLVVKVKEVVMP